MAPERVGRLQQRAVGGVIAGVVAWDNRRYFRYGDHSLDRSSTLISSLQVVLGLRSGRWC